MPWRELEDPTSGRKFWYDDETKQSRWTLPAASSSDSSAAGDSPLTTSAKNLGEWELMEDPTTNRHYYYNRKDGRSMWEMPDEVRLAKASQVDDETWKELVDHATGRTYWYEKATGRSTWENPHEKKSDDDGVKSENIKEQETEDQAWARRRVNQSRRRSWGTVRSF